MNQVFRPYLQRFVNIFFMTFWFIVSLKLNTWNTFNAYWNAFLPSNFFSKFTKYQFFQSIVEYLGHVVTRGGVQTDPKNIAAMLNWPIPRTLK